MQNYILMYYIALGINCLVGRVCQYHFAYKMRCLILKQSSDDVFKSTFHRAINRTGVERYSMPVFFGVDYNVRLEVCLYKYHHVPNLDIN